MKLKLGKKLLLGFGAIIVSSMAISTYTVDRLLNIDSMQEEIVYDQYASVRTLMSLQADLISSRRSVLEQKIHEYEEEGHTKGQNQEGDEHIQMIVDAVTAADADLEEYGTLLSNEEERQIYNAFKERVDLYLEEVDKLYQMFANGEEVELSDLEVTEALFTDLMVEIDEIVQLNQEYLDSAASESDRSINQSLFVTVSGMIISLGLSIVIGIIISRGILKSTDNILKVVFEATKGDLTQEIEIVSQDEMGDIAHAVNNLIQSLANMTKEIMDVGVELSASSDILLGTSEEATVSINQVNASIGDLANGTLEQTRAVQDTEESITNVAKSIDTVAEHAIDVSASTKKMVKISSSGLVEAQKASDTILQIKEATDAQVK